MTEDSGVFALEREGQTLIVTALSDLREWDFQEIEAEAREILLLLGNGAIKNVVMDFHKSDCYGSTALGFFVKLWKRVRECGGRMAFCGVSEHELEILKVTNLDNLWPICPTREAALKAVRRTAGPP